MKVCRLAPALAAALFACGGSTPGEIIVAVTLSPASATVAPGATQQFTATVSGTLRTAVSWSVAEGASGGKVSADGLYTAPGAGGTAHVVAASQVDPTKTATAVVTVLPGPQIASFSAAPATVAPGQASTLSWSAANATSLAIDNGVGDVTAAASSSVSPAATTTYKLTATGAGGLTATKTVTVTVSTAPPPTISSFSATPSAIAAGGSSTLAWSVSGAASLAIDNGVGVVTGTGKSVTPAATTTYTLTATSAAGATATRLVTVTVNPAPAKPVISQFVAVPGVITSGGSSTLSWTVSGATSISIDNGIGTVAGNSKSISPSATITYTLTASNAAGNATATVQVQVQAAGAADATIAIDTAQDRAAISPQIYGYNAGSAAEAPAGATLLRIGGNRWTAYNWASNYSNAGSDYGPYHNDTLMGQPSDGPGHAIVPTIDDAKAHGLAALITIPMQGWVSKDASGNVALSSALSEHFIPNLASKPGGVFTLTPDPASATVYQDELAHFVANRLGVDQAPQIELDNEPDLWGWVDGGGQGHATHPEIQRLQASYQSFASQSIASAKAIKAAVPTAKLFGPVSFGWGGYINFLSAPDAPADASIDQSFLDDYLARMKTASDAAGVRLLDAFDLHYYTEATADHCGGAASQGLRVNFSNSYDTTHYAVRNDACSVAARVQSARSLWDPTYVESSWITQYSTFYSSLGQPMRTIPRMMGKIAANYPGTAIAFTEYNFGGGDHVSGALAQADTLGIFGRQGVRVAALWPLLGDNTWLAAAWRAYRNYDASGTNFGDTAVRVSTSDLDHVSAFASVDSGAPDRVVVVLVHRPTATLSGGVVTGLDNKARVVKLQLAHGKALTHARAWQLPSGATPSWQALAAPSIAGNVVTITLPGSSVTTVELTP